MTITPSPPSRPDPEILIQMQFSFAPALALTTGIQLRVFSHIADGRSTVTEIAAAAKASERGTRMLLDFLVACQLLTKSNDRYDLTPLAAEYLVCDRPNYIGAMRERGNRLLDSWLDLTEAVRLGGPRKVIEDQERAESIFPEVVKSLHILQQENAQRVAEALGVASTSRGIRVLDVACGSGVFGLAIARRNPTAFITAQDFPKILQVTKQHVRQYGLDHQYDFIEGNIKTVDFGNDRFQIAILGNIVHSIGANSSCDLFRKVLQALTPGGRIVVVEIVANDQRTGPSPALVFALNMLVNTMEGDTFTVAEYRDLLTKTGFEQIEACDIGSLYPLIVARKPVLKNDRPVGA